MTEPIGTDQIRFASTINRAIRLADVGQISTAVDILSKLVRQYKEAASVRAYLGWFLIQLGRKKEAISQSRKAIELAPQSEKASLVYFHVLWQAGKKIDALDEMKRFLVIRPSKVYAKMIESWEPDIGYQKRANHKKPGSSERRPTGRGKGPK